MIANDIAQDFAKMSVDPCYENVSLESLMKRVEQVRTEVENVHVRVPSEKIDYNVAALPFMVETSRLLGIE